MTKGNTCLLRQAYYFVIFGLLLLTGCGEKPKPGFSFAVIGDIHYESPDFRSAEYLVPPLGKELSALDVRPEFIVQTGDFFHGSRGPELESEALFSFKNFAENMRIPFFIAKGNHDTREYYEKNALPLFSGELKTKIVKSYYSFDKYNCHFIMLDCTAEKLEDQLAWLEKDLETTRANSKIEHIFAAGHYPLWIVARAGFTRRDYAVAVSSILAKYRVDAYFCGHTHNKTATVRMINGQPLTQIMDAAVVEEGRLFNLAPYLRHTRPVPENPLKPGILSLEEGHQIFIPGSEILYFWGYQEGSTTSYNVITVKGKNVQVDWHVLGQGVIRSYTWNEPGKIIDLKIPVKKEKVPLTEADLNNIEKAWLYAAPWTQEESIIAPITINGKHCGTLEISKAKMAYSPFWNKVEIQLKDPVKGIIKKENEINLTNPGKSKFGLAHMFILVKLSDGRFTKSSVSQKIITSFRPEEGLPNFPAAELIDPVDLGNPLAKVSLRFDGYIEN